MNNVHSTVVKVRLYYLDWLRVVAFSLLVFYHTGLIFVDWGFHIQNDEFSSGLKIPLLFLNQWRLPLLFFVSGAGIRFALGFRTSAVFLKERFIRLLIPLVFGILFVIPAQVYFERLYQGVITGSYIEFFPQFFNGIYPHGNFTWNHLWFLVYLIVYILIALPLFLYFRHKNGEAQMHTFAQFLSRKVNLLLLVIPLFLTEVLLRDLWPDTRNLVSDWYNFTYYFIILLYGYIVASNKLLWPTIEKDRLIYFVLGIISFCLIFFGWHQEGESFLERIAFGDIIFKFFKSLNILVWILCSLGYAKRYLSFNTPVLQYTNKAVYPFYILHQTVLLGLGYYIIKTELSIFTKYTLIVMGTFFITMIVYDLIIKRTKWLKIFFGIK